MKLRREFVGLVEKAYRDVDLSWKILVASCERRPADCAECAHHARIGDHLAPFVRRESHRSLIEGRKRRDGCPRYPPAIGTVAVGDRVRRLRRADLGCTTIAPPCNHSRSGLIRHGHFLRASSLTREIARISCFASKFPSRIGRSTTARSTEMAALRCVLATSRSSPPIMARTGSSLSSPQCLLRTRSGRFGDHQQRPLLAEAVVGKPLRVRAVVLEGVSGPVNHGREPEGDLGEEDDQGEAEAPRSRKAEVRPGLAAARPAE